VVNAVNFGDNYSYTTMMVYVSQHLKTRYPEHEDYIDGLLNTNFASVTDMAEIVGDPTMKFGADSLARTGGQESLDIFKRKLIATGLALGEDFDALDPAALIEMVTKNTHTLTHSAGDGYSLDIMVNPNEELSEQDWQAILHNYAEEIEKAKN